jgi:hypothetical protein
MLALFSIIGQLVLHNKNSRTTRTVVYVQLPLDGTFVPASRVAGGASF